MMEMTEMSNKQLEQLSPQDPDSITGLPDVVQLCLGEMLVFSFEGSLGSPGYMFR